MKAQKPSSNPASFRWSTLWELVKRGQFRDLYHYITFGLFCLVLPG